MNSSNNFKKSFAEHFDQMHIELDRDVTKVWTFWYENDEFRITNTLNKETLHINGKLVAQSVTTAWWQRLIPYRKLTFSMMSQDKKREVVVLIGGVISLKVIVKVDNVICFEDKVSIPLF